MKVMEAFFKSSPQYFHPPCHQPIGMGECVPFATKLGRPLTRVTIIIFDENLQPIFPCECSDVTLSGVPLYLDILG